MTGAICRRCRLAYPKIQSAYPSLFNPNTPPRAPHSLCIVPLSRFRFLFQTRHGGHRRSSAEQNPHRGHSVCRLRADPQQSGREGAHNEARVQQPEEHQQGGHVGPRRRARGQDPK